jgi:hypothetical protein
LPEFGHGKSQNENGYHKKNLHSSLRHLTTTKTPKLLQCVYLAEHLFRSMYNCSPSSASRSRRNSLGGKMRTDRSENCIVQSFTIIFRRNRQAIIGLCIWHGGCN